MEASREESLPCPGSTDYCKYPDRSVRSALRIRSCTSNSIYDVHSWYRRDYFLCSTRNGSLLCIKEIRKDIICTVNSRLPRHSCCEVRVMQLHDILLLRTSASLHSVSVGAKPLSTGQCAPCQRLYQLGD